MTKPRSNLCVICGSSLAAAHWNATACSEACKAERDRRYRSEYQNENRERCRLSWRKYAAKPEVKDRKRRHARATRERNPEAARARDKQKRLRRIERVRAYDREWKRQWRADHPELAKQKQRVWWMTMAAALLAVKEVLGEPANPARVGARREAPANPATQSDITIERIRNRQCLCCGVDISDRPARVKVCADAECHRERARQRATEYRWKNIELAREKDRVRSNAKREQNKPRLAKYRQENRDRLIAKSRSRYRENGDAIRAQRYDRYLQLRAARSLIKELQPEIHP